MRKKTNVYPLFARQFRSILRQLLVTDCLGHVCSISCNIPAASGWTGQNKVEPVEFYLFGCRFGPAAAVSRPDQIAVRDIVNQAKLVTTRRSIAGRVGTPT